MVKERDLATDSLNISGHNGAIIKRKKPTSKILNLRTCFCEPHFEFFRNNYVPKKVIRVQSAFMFSLNIFVVTDFHYVF